MSTEYERSEIRVDVPINASAQTRQRKRGVLKIVLALSTITGLLFLAAGGHGGDVTKPMADATEVSTDVGMQLRVANSHTVYFPELFERRPGKSGEAQPSTF
jgi:hypothetical protein